MAMFIQRYRDDAGAYSIGLEQKRKLKLETDTSSTIFHRLSAL
jgi:hypothetical protein